MRSFLFLWGWLAMGGLAAAQSPAPVATQAAAPVSWRTQLAQELPLLGHRNWILIVDSAYPLEVAPGVETIETGSDQLVVVHTVMEMLDRMPHVAPYVQMDAELPFVAEDDAPGIGRYRRELDDVLGGLQVERLPHEQILAEMGEVANQFHVLVLKTRTALPYTSVFVRLECRYWPAEAEQRLRRRMAEGRN